MTHAETDTGSDDELSMLCRACGLCCDGSLFGRVPLTPDEVPIARKNRLAVLQNGSAFEQPCSALSSSTGGYTCSVYAERPRPCRAFTCRLFERHRREGGPIGVPLDAVRRARELLSFVEATTDEDARAPALAELTQRMEDDFARA